MTGKFASTALLLMLMTQSGCVFLTPLIDKAPDRPYSVTIRTRDRWPEGVPVRVEVDYGGPMFHYQDLVAEATPVMTGGTTVCKWMSHGCGVLPIEITQEIGTPPAGTKSIDFRLKVKRTDVYVFNTKWIGQTTVPIEIGGTVDDILTPVRFEELDRKFRETFKVEVRRACWGVDSSSLGPWTVSIRQLPELGALDDDMTFAMTFQVLRNGELIASTEAWWRLVPFKGGHYAMPPGVQYGGGLQLNGDLSRLVWDASDGARWTMRIVPNPVLALRNFRSDRYWGSVVDLPLRVVQTEQSWDTGSKSWNRKEQILYDGAAHQSQESTVMR